MIAATAMANDLAVYTCNPGDFEGIEGLDVIQLPHPDTAPDEEHVRR
jgi:predicted nucleic acid-binding protein